MWGRFFLPWGGALLFLFVFDAPHILHPDFNFGGFDYF